jgi:hypothetical protein
VLKKRRKPEELFKLVQELKEAIEKQNALLEEIKGMLGKAVVFVNVGNQTSQDFLIEDFHSLDSSGCLFRILKREL